MEFTIKEIYDIYREMDKSWDYWVIVSANDLINKLEYINNNIKYESIIEIEWRNTNIK